MTEPLNSLRPASTGPATQVRLTGYVFIIH